MIRFPTKINPLAILPTMEYWEQPILLSANDQGLEVTASDPAVAGDEPYKIFDQSGGNGWKQDIVANPIPSWVKLSIPYGIELYSITLVNRADSSEYSMKSFSISGSLNGETWLDIYSTASGISAAGARLVCSLSSPYPFIRHLKLNVTEGNGAAFVGLASMHIRAGVVKYSI